MFQIIVDAISKCNNIEEIEFKLFPEGWLSKFSKPLPKVSSVTLICCDLDDGSLLLSHVFPKLNTLVLIYIEDSKNYKIIDTHFPYLEELTLQISDPDKSSEIEPFLNLNLQIKKLRLLISNPSDNKFIQLISERMQQMLDLAIQAYELPRNKSYHFESVRRFSCIENVFSFTFDQLEELTLCKRMNMDQIDEIMKQNRKVKMLSLSERENMNSINTLKELGELSEIQFSINGDTEDMDGIIKFLSKKSSLSKIIINFFHMHNFIFSDVQRKIDRTKWNVNYNDVYKHSVTFTRKIESKFLGDLGYR